MLEPVLLESEPPPETTFQFTAWLNVPVPLTAAFKLELPAEATVFGVAVALIPVMALTLTFSTGQAVSAIARSGKIHFLFIVHLI